MAQFRGGQASREIRALLFCVIASRLTQYCSHKAGSAGVPSASVPRLINARRKRNTIGLSLKQFRFN
jgi:hypothetical protein